MKKIILITILFFTFNCFLFAKESSKFVSYFPYIEPINFFTKNLQQYLNKFSDTHFFIVKNPNLFKDEKEIFEAVQEKILHFAVIPTYLLKKLVTDFKNKDKINLRLKLKQFGIFFIDEIPGGKIFLFSKKPITYSLAKTQISIGTLSENKNHIKKLKKYFLNVITAEQVFSIKNFIKEKFIDAYELTLGEAYFIEEQPKFIYSYGKKAPNRSYSLIANYNLWKNLNFTEKSLVWTFIIDEKNKYLLNLKKFEDKLINKFSKKAKLKNISIPLY